MLCLRLQSSGCCRSFVFELKVLRQLRNGSRVCAWNWTGSDRTTLVLQMAQWTGWTSGRIEQKSTESSRNGGLEPGTRLLTLGGVRSEERENEEFSGKMGHAGGVCRRSPSWERPQAKSLTFDFVAGLHAFDHDRPLWCVLSKDCFVADNLFCFVVSFFFLSLACASASCSWHLLSFCFFFPRHEDVASLLEEACVMIAVWGLG